MKKIFTVVFILLLCVCSGTTAFADTPKESLPNSDILAMKSICNNPIVLKDKSMEQDINYNLSSMRDIDTLTFNRIHEYARASGILDSTSSSIIHMEDGDYKYDYSEKKTKSISGFAGNQGAKDGYQFPTGGGFYFSESGGPTGTLTVEFPKPYSNVSFSVNFGNKANSGLFVSVPSKTKWYKLKVQKQYEVQTYIIYRRQTSSEPWYTYSGGTLKKLVNQKQWAEEVKK